jgi:hypothetical protein
MYRSTNSTWTWTLLRTKDPDQLHYFCRSPEGRLILPKYFCGKPFTIKAHNVDRGEPAQPRPAELAGSQDVFLVPLDPETLMATYIRPDGTPEPPQFSFRDMWRAAQKPDGSWCFLPKSDTADPQTRYQQTGEAQPLLPVVKDAVLTCGPRKPVLKVNAEGPEPKDFPAALKQPEAVVNKKQDPEGQNYGNAACTEASRSASPQLPNYQLTQLPNPTAMMDNLEALIRQHLVCNDHQSAVLALWILHTYTYRSTPLTPYLNISSRVEESGKSTCMAILRRLCARPWWAAGVSRSAFTRKITSDQPTVLLDNWQTVFSSSDKTQITGFLLNGCDQAPNLDHDHCAEVSRSNDLNYPITNLPNYQIQNAANPIDSFCPKAFAGQESLPSTLSRRSIPIVLQRRKPDEIVKRAGSLLAPGATHKFTSWMQEWARANRKQIETTFENSESQSPGLPGLSPHQQQAANVLIALAATVGGGWSQKARAALPEVFKDAQQRELAPLHLLSDIRDAFAHHGNPERIFTAELLDYLHGLDHRIWHEWGKKGEPMTPHALSVILRKSFKIYSRSQRRGEHKLRGYQRSDFLEAWERYLSTVNPQSAPGHKSSADAQETPVAATTKIESVNKNHAPRQIAVTDSTHPKRRTEVARTEVSQRRAEVRQTNKTAHPRRPRFTSMSRIKTGCRRLVNKFTANWF